jgi:hypothetical protein
VVANQNQYEIGQWIEVLISEANPRIVWRLRCTEVEVSPLNASQPPQPIRANRHISSFAQKRTSRMSYPTIDPNRTTTGFQQQKPAGGSFSAATPPARA